VNEVRATIPEEVVKFLGLKPGDQLAWNMRVTVGVGRKYVEVEKK